MSVGEPLLTIVTGGAEKRSYLLPPRTVLRIGRSDGNDIMLTDDMQASREHALLRRDSGGQCILLDLGSRNGTLVNGRNVTVSTRLRDGDVIRIGSAEFAFSDPLGMGDAKSAPAPGTRLFLASSLISVLVIDICGYTTLARELGEERISALLSDLFREAGEMLDARGCWSKKFIGDAIMGVWQHPERTVSTREFQSIVDVIIGIRALATDLSEQHGLEKPLRFGVGINTGAAQVGNIGSSSSNDFTALGDAVNLAFRLQAETRRSGYDIHIGKTTLDTMSPHPPRVAMPPVIDVTIRGYDVVQKCHGVRLRELNKLSTLSTHPHW
jgi:adenylate cyclase